MSKKQKNMLMSASDIRLFTEFAESCGKTFTELMTEAAHEKITKTQLTGNLEKVLRDIAAVHETIIRDIANARLGIIADTKSGLEQIRAAGEAVTTELKHVATAELKSAHAIHVQLASRSVEALGMQLAILAGRPELTAPAPAEKPIIPEKQKIPEKNQTRIQQSSGATTEGFGWSRPTDEN
ncbi:hypothetical protein [Pseudoxanthomonas winnipegensis]|uniref:Uncharacterized protein n=1 Tax=Pseudoxanthomonas winnipegensis TaxID=2480810 RepID=A0A4Q8M3G3_9GAMM|nr:hypothetical protein [Pseudoxanthomonas winnipegensis]TAA41532.1 hypothetical protein EA655_11360 [Pseudoxanthomonas winnipegensis]